MAGRPMNLRMRQICLVARELAPTVETFGEVFGLEVCYRDPGVGSTGSRTRSSPSATASSRWWPRPRTAPRPDATSTGGAGTVATWSSPSARTWRRGARCETVGVRVANEIRHADYHELQLHPRDVGAAMLSFSRQEGGEAADGPWHPAASRGRRRGAGDQCGP